MRRDLSITLLALGLAVAAHDAIGQGITLPSPRTVGPSPAVQQLVQLVADADTWIDKSDTARYNAMQLVRYRLLLAPFTKRELRRILANPTEEEIWARLYQDVLEDGNRGIALAIRRRLRKLDQQTIAYQSTLIAFALSGRDSLALPTQRDSLVSREVLKLSRDTLGMSRRSAVQQTIQSLVGTEQEQRGVVAVDDEEALYLPAMLADGADDAMRARLDSLGRVAELVVTERKTDRFWLPVRTTQQARVFWKQQGFAPLNLGALTGNKAAGAAFTELTSPLLHAFRLSLNTVIATNSEETASDTPEDPPTDGNETELTRFLNGGGQLNVAGAMPLVHAGRRSGSAAVLMIFAPRLGVTLGALGAVQTDETAFFDPAVELHFTSSEVSEKVGFFAQFRSGWALGGDSFASNLGLPKSDKRFAYTNTAFGLMFGGRYLLSGGRTINGPKALRDLGWQVGVTLMRSAQ